MQIACVVSSSALNGHEELLTVNETGKILKMVTALIIHIMLLLLWTLWKLYPDVLFTASSKFLA